MGRLPVHNGRVEGHVFISSCESPQIPAICLRTIDTGNHQKKMAHIQRKRSHNKMVGEVQSW